MSDITPYVHINLFERQQVRRLIETREHLVPNVLQFGILGHVFLQRPFHERLGDRDRLQHAVFGHIVDGNIDAFLEFRAAVHADEFLDEFVRQFHDVIISPFCRYLVRSRRSRVVYSFIRSSGIRSGHVFFPLARNQSSCTDS